MCAACESVGEQFRWDPMNIYSVTRGVFALLAICKVQLALFTPNVLADNEADGSKKQPDLEAVLGVCGGGKTCLIGACRDWGVG